MPGDASFSLRAKTKINGSIQTDWGSPTKGWGFGKSYEVDANGGGDRVELETLNGSIRVEQVDE